MDTQKETAPAPTDAVQSLTADKPLDTLDPTFDVLALSPREFAIAMAFYLSGRMSGLDDGRRQADDEAAAFHREAVRVVRLMASIPPRDPEADAAAAARREARWVA